MLSKRKLFSLTILLIGVHSILLGVFIYFNTNGFYQIFFDTDITNLFYVRQSGLFLILSGLFYLLPLKDLKRLYEISVITIISKIAAVIFLITNAGLTPNPNLIYLAAFFDGLMAIVLTLTYFMFKSDVNSQ